MLERIAIEKPLRGTRRKGMGRLINYLAQAGFFEAPASSGNHLHVSGGLALHSWHVYLVAHKIAKQLLTPEQYKEMKSSITIAALLHDVGKCGDYGKQLYVDNVLKSGKVSTAKPYERNKNLTPVPHGSRSVFIIERYIQLTEEEEFAIAYHDGLEEPSNVAVLKGLNFGKHPLLLIIHWADMWASQVLEGGTNNGTENTDNG